MLNIFPYKLVILLFVWCVGLLLPIVVPLWNDWMDISDNSHGVLVPIIALYFVLEKRNELKSAPISPSVIGGIVFLVSLLLYIVAFAGGVAFVARFMIVSSLWGIVLYNYGRDVFKTIGFPLLFLVFMIPVPISVIQGVSFPLQLFATNIATQVITLFSIPVYQEGNMLYFANNTQLEVAQACSGLRSIISLFMLSVIFVYISGSGQFAMKIIMLLSAIPVAIVVNIIRVSGTGILAHYYGSVVAQGFLHEFSGIAVFVVGLLLLFFEFTVLKKIFH